MLPLANCTGCEGGEHATVFPTGTPVAIRSGVVSLRAHPGECGAGSAGGGPRLNLLLTCAAWQPDPWVDRLPPMLEPFGVVSLRARSGMQASRIIQDVNVHMAVVDLALPLEETEAFEPDLAEGGPRLLEILSRLSAPPPVVAVKRSRTHRDDARDIAAALRLGAFAVIDRPRDPADINLLLDVLRRCLERHYRGFWPGMATG
jgi:CheY-like chemotaxis protein